MAAEITPADAGCWLDGHYGWHNTYRVIETAQAYGFTMSADDREAVARFAASENDDNDAEWVYELSHDATEYLQNLAPDGYSFVWEDGLFLWADDPDGVWG